MASKLIQKKNSIEELAPADALPHNIFAAMELSHPEERRAKAMLSILIEQRIDELGLTQTQAAERMGLRQPEVSKIVRGINSGFSYERLFEALGRLGNPIKIVVGAASSPKSTEILRVVQEPPRPPAKTRAKARRRASNAPHVLVS